MAIPIVQVIDRESQSVAALASTPEKADAMITALKAMPGNSGYDFYADEALSIDLIEY